MIVLLGVEGAAFGGPEFGAALVVAARDHLRMAAWRRKAFELIPEPRDDIESDAFSP